MNNTLLSAQQLTKKVWGRVILKDVSFTMQQGEILGLLGPNGAGKTTIIRCLCGLTKLQHGKVIINGFDLHQHFKKAIANLGVTIENPNFYNYMSGWENLMQLVRADHLNISMKAINDIIARVKLTDAIHHRVSTYSLGMRQRLNIAMWLLMKPRILLLDEPLNGLDPNGMYLLRNTLKQLASQGSSILVSSHVLHDVEQIANHVVILQKGQVIYDDSLVHLNQGNHRVIHLQVDNIKKTIKILNKLQLRFYMQNQIFVIETIKDVDHIQQTLLQNLLVNNINVKAIYTQATSLEEKFLNITNKENNHVSANQK